MAESDGKNWFKEIKNTAKSEGFPHPARVIGDPKLTLPEKSSASLAKEYDFFEGWYVRAKVKATEYYIISKTVGNKSKEYCYYKFYDTLAQSYESRVKKVSREYSRREHEYKANKI